MAGALPDGGYRIYAEERAFRKPLVSESVRVRRIFAIGIFATLYEMPRLFASDSDEYTMGPLHRAYFNGEALWTYLTTPFLLAMHGVRVEETEAWREGPETWRVLRAYFPGLIETHSLVQDFFFGEEMLLRRHDYTVNIAGGFQAAQLTSEYAKANGIGLPTRRRAYARGPDRQPIRDMLMVSIDFSEVRFE